MSTWMALASISPRKWSWLPAAEVPNDAFSGFWRIQPTNSGSVLYGLEAPVESASCALARWATGVKSTAGS
ncbi:hypothetical protein D3C80_2116700 [compost metagenome]